MFIFIGFDRIIFFPPIEQESLKERETTRLQKIVRVNYGMINSYVNTGISTQYSFILCQKQCSLYLLKFCFLSLLYFGMCNRWDSTKSLSKTDFFVDAFNLFSSSTKIDKEAKELESFLPLNHYLRERDEVKNLSNFLHGIQDDEKYLLPYVGIIEDNKQTTTRLSESMPKKHCLMVDINADPQQHKIRLKWGEVRLDQINDDYCDCLDGWDEPGTAACSGIDILTIDKPLNLLKLEGNVQSSSANFIEEVHKNQRNNGALATFYCRNLGYQGYYIPSSKVNDGICDCCDGSDEFAVTLKENEENLNQKLSKCPNTCLSKGKQLREENERSEKIYQEGSLKLKASTTDSKNKLLEISKSVEKYHSQKDELEDLLKQVEHKNENLRTDMKEKLETQAKKILLYLTNDEKAQLTIRSESDAEIFMKDYEDIEEKLAKMSGQ